MKVSSSSKLLFLLFSISFLSPCGRCNNVSIDDADSTLSYTPQNAWTSSNTPLDLDFQHYHQLTDSSHPNATCTFSFTGTALYMITPLWPYKVGASVSVDGSPGVAINMTDPNAPTQDSGGSETAGFRDVLVSDNLDNKTHSVTISLLPGMDFLAIDGLKYTVPGDNSTDSSSSSSSSHSNPIPIVVGVVGGVVFLALVALTFVLLRRRRRTQFSPVNILGDSRPSSPDPQQGLYDPATHELERATLRSPPAPVLVGGPLSNHSSQTQGYGHLSGDRDTTAAAIRGPVTLSYTDLRRESSEFGLRPTTLYSAAASSASSSSGDPGSSSSRLVAGIYSEKKFESATEEKRRLKEAAEKQEERSEYPDLPPPMYEEHSS